MNNLSPSQIQADIAKGSFRPNQFLSDMCIASFQAASNYAAKNIFPILPVSLATSSYYVFSRDDLARDNVRKKPQFGKV